MKKLFNKITKGFQDDINLLKEVFSGNYKSKYNKSEILNLKGVFKEYWILFILLIAAFGAGFFISEVTSNNDCIEFVEEKVLPNCEGYNKVDQEQYLNFTLEDKQDGRT